MLDGVPGTSILGLKARANEHRLPERLFADPLAVEWQLKLSPFVKEDILQWYTPVLQQSIAIRTDIFDRAVRHHLSQVKDPVVVELGAGFSTRFSRLRTSLELAKGQWYELDVPELIELRASLEKPSERHWYLAESIFAEAWMDALSDYAPEQIFFLAEGLLMYFPLKRVQNWLERMRLRFAGSRMALDVLGKMYLKAAQAPGEMMGAPIYWGMPDLNTAYRELGLEPLSDFPLHFSAHLQERAYRRRLKWRHRLLLRQSWLTRRMGGTLYGRLHPEPPAAQTKKD